MIIDDDPSSAFPERAIVWKGDAQWQNLLKTIFAQSSPSDELIELVGQIIENVQATNGRYQNLLSARLVDLSAAVFWRFGKRRNHNRRCKSFIHGIWSLEKLAQCFNAAQVAGRLVDYFKISNPKPHPAFAYSEEALNIVGCSYAWNAAHIDISPRATLSANRETSDLFFQMLEMDLTWIPKLFALANNCREIWFVGGLGKNHPQPICCCIHCPKTTTILEQHWGETPSFQ